MRASRILALFVTSAPPGVSGSQHGVQGPSWRIQAPTSHQGRTKRVGVAGSKRPMRYSKMFAASWEGFWNENRTKIENFGTPDALKSTKILCQKRFTKTTIFTTSPTANSSFRTSRF